MGRVYVRGHYRRRRRSNSGGNGCLFRALGICAIIIFAVYLVSSIPSQVVSTFFILLLVGGVSFATFKVFQARKRKQQEIAYQAEQQYLQQAQAQRQIEQHQLQIAQQHYAAQIQAQREQEQERARLARIKTLGDILTLTPKEFEELVGKILHTSGLQNVQRVGGSGDLGVDLTAVDMHGNRVVVQCKRYAPGRSIGSPDLQKFIGMMHVHHKAQKGIFVTTSEFKQTAKDLASNSDILLIDGTRLVGLVQNLIK